VPHRDRAQLRALSEAEQQAILHHLHSDRFTDAAPAKVWATLLDEGVCLGSVSTACRLLRAAGESRQRRRQAIHPATVRPELAAAAPNAVWSWDITKRRGPAKRAWHYLYVILDTCSRYVTGWMAASRESAGLAEVLIRQACASQGIGASPADQPRRPRLVDGVQACGVPARRSRHHPVAFAPARLQRQPVQRGAVSAGGSN
jgi:putative transposase